MRRALHRAIGIGFLVVSSLAAPFSITASKAETACKGTACVFNEVPACWGKVTRTFGEGLLSEGKVDLVFGRAICLEKGNRVSTSALYGDEGLGDEGTYRLLEGSNKVEFSVFERGAEGWGAFFSHSKVACELSLTPMKQLMLTSCSDERDQAVFDLDEEMTRWVRGAK